METAGIEPASEKSSDRSPTSVVDVLVSLSEAPANEILVS